MDSMNKIDGFDGILNIGYLEEELPDNAAVVGPCRVYCTNNHSELSLRKVATKTNVPEGIATIYGRMQSLLAPAEHPDSADLFGRLFVLSAKENPEIRRALVFLLSHLCIEKTDTKAHDILIPMLEKALNPDVEIVPSDNPDHSGIYYLSLYGEKFAVFKVGEKRARYETLVRATLHKIGLEERFIPVVPCSIENPSFSEDEDVVVTVELFNGHQKVFIEPNESVAGAAADEKKCTLTGVLVPFVTFGKEKNVDAFAELVVGCLVAGVRDAKDDAVADGCVLVDYEEALPNRLAPETSPQRRVAATHLPFLDDEIANQPIPMAKIEELRDKLRDAGTYGAKITNYLEGQTVKFADPKSEALKPADEELVDYEDNRYLAQGQDHGDFKVESVFMKKMGKDDLYPSLKLDKKNPKGTKLMSASQLRATAERIDRLQECLEKPQALTAAQIVKYVDLFYAAHYKDLQNTGFSRVPKSSVVGSQTPASCKRAGSTANSEASSSYWKGVEQDLTRSREQSPLNTDPSPRFSFSGNSEMVVGISPYSETRARALSRDSTFDSSRLLFASIDINAEDDEAPFVLQKPPSAIFTVEEKKEKNG
jgi:hypothetical protein